MSSETSRHVAGAMDFTAERVAINEVIGAYGLYFDTAQWDAFEDLFTEDAHYNITPDPNLVKLPLLGARQIRTEMQARRALTGSAVSPRHFATNIVFQQIGRDNAAATSFLLVSFTHHDGRLEVRRAGNYVDTFKRDGNRWRFSSRHLQLDTAAPPPSA